MSKGGWEFEKEGGDHCSIEKRKRREDVCVPSKMGEVVERDEEGGG